MPENDIYQDLTITDCNFIYPESDHIYVLDAPVEIRLIDSAVKGCLFTINCPANLQPKMFLTINGDRGLLIDSTFVLNIVEPEPEPEPTLYTNSKNKQTRMIDKGEF